MELQQSCVEILTRSAKNISFITRKQMNTSASLRPIQDVWSRRVSVPNNTRTVTRNEIDEEALDALSDGRRPSQLQKDLMHVRRRHMPTCFTIDACWNEWCNSPTPGDQYSPRPAAEDPIGFDLRQIRESGALQLPLEFGHNLVDERSTLDIDILPIFHISRWNRDCRHLYRVLEPALRLASMFLTHPSVSEYWLTVVHGKREWNVNPDGSEATLHRNQKNFLRIQEPVPYSRAAHQEVLDMLTVLQDKMTLTFKDNVQGSLGALDFHTAANGVGIFVIALNRECFHAATCYADARTTSGCEFLRFSFQLATTIVHEIAHVFEILYNEEEIRPGEDELETRFFGSDSSEAGEAWEVSVFGAIVRGINSTCDGLYGVCAFYGRFGNPMICASVPTFAALPMAFLWGVQQAGYWRERRWESRTGRWVRSGWGSAVAKGWNVVPELCSLV